MNRRWVGRLVFLGVVVLAGLASWWSWWRPSPAGKASRGQVVYEKQCAACHGPAGDGQGAAAFILQPKPRNLRAGKFRLVSSQGLQPTREDLFQTISNGMPGTPMPSWAHLSESDRWALADYVLQLNRQGWYDKGIQLGYTKDEAEKYAAEMTQPGPAFQVPPEPSVSPEGFKQGKQFYLTACANCHGENAEGRQDPTWRTAEGFPTWSRNLREGVFKGGREGKQLYMRFASGLPGTPMPSQSLSPEQTWRVVQYVLSLSDPAAQERAQTRVQEIAAKRVSRLPSNPDDAGWQTVSATRIPLMPLWWHKGYLEAVRVRAVHDGQRLALLLEWDDPSRDVEGIRPQSFPDGAAVQLAAGDSPPLFAMGAAGEEVNIWHWKALWDEDRREFQDVATVYPGLVSGPYYGSGKGWKAGPFDDATFRPAAGVHNLMASTERKSIVEDANAAGFGTITSQALKEQNVDGVARWKDGVWSLELVRELEPKQALDVPLRQREKVSIAFAVWDGNAGDRNGQKSVSLWNPLILE